MKHNSKITVKDAKGQYHAFKGNDLFFRRDGDYYDILDSYDKNGERQVRQIGSCTAPCMIRYEDIEIQDKAAEQKNGYSRTEDHIDPFTEAALKDRGHTPPDINKLAPHSEIAIPDAQASAYIDEKELTDNPSESIKNASSTPEIEKQQGFIMDQEEEPAPDLDDLLDDGVIRKGIRPEEEGDTEAEDIDVEAVLDKAEAEYKAKTGSKNG